MHGSTFPDAQLPGQILFSKVAGSHSFNLAMPESDMDYLAVYIAPTEKVLSIDPPPETLDHKGPDWSAHEVGKFCRLLLKGNPNMVETLFTSKLACGLDPWWSLLQAKRTLFLTKRVVLQYLGYCQAQLHKLVAHSGTGGLHTSGGAYNTKWAYHMVRLVQDADAISSGMEPVLWKEGPERDMLMEVRRGEWTQGNVENLVRHKISSIDARKPWHLPDEGDRVVLNEWLLGIRCWYMMEKR